MGSSQNIDHDFTRRMYSIPGPLSSRFETHKKHSTNPISFQDWVISAVTWKGTEFVLDLGCGIGAYCPAVTRRLSSGTYIGIDNSSALVRTAQNQNRMAKSRPIFKFGDAHNLPFEPGSFDVVLANHVLYHLDVETALSEIRRVLKKTGILIAATNSESSMPELDQLHRLASGAAGPARSTFRSFSLESGGGHLKKAFASVETRRYQDTLRFSHAEDVVKYYASGWVFRNSEGSHDFELPEEELVRRCSRITVEVQQRIQNSGYFEIHKKLGAFLAADVQLQR